MSKVFWTIFCAAWVLVIGYSIAFPFIESKAISEGKKIITEDLLLTEEFGEIENVRLSYFGYIQSNKTKCNFTLTVKGSKKKALVQVYCLKINDKVVVRKIMRNYGFGGEHMIWPVTGKHSNPPLLPTHIWNGIDSLFRMILTVLLYIELKRKGWLTINFLSKLFGSGIDKVTFVIGLSIPLLFLLSLLYFTDIMYS